MSQVIPLLRGFLRSSSRERAFYFAGVGDALIGIALIGALYLIVR